MSESTPPPAVGGGNMKYGIIGAALIAATIAIWFGMQSCEQPPPPAPPPQRADAGTVERSTALVDDDLIIPVEEDDAGPGEDAGPPRVRYVTRYVGGGSWSCSGQIDAAAARRALAQYNLQFRNCYERRLKVNNALEGRVNLQMRVGRNGAVSAVRTGGSLRDPQVLSCVRNIAQRIRFPHPTGGCAVVAAPFNFTPRR